VERHQEQAHSRLLAGGVHEAKEKGRGFLAKGASKVCGGSLTDIGNASWKRGGRGLHL